MSSDSSELSDLQKKTAKYCVSSTMVSSMGLVISSMWLSTFISVSQSSTSSSTVRSPSYRLGIPS